MTLAEMKEELAHARKMQRSYDKNNSHGQTHVDWTREWREYAGALRRSINKLENKSK